MPVVRHNQMNREFDIERKETQPRQGSQDEKSVGSVHATELSIAS